VSSSVGRGVGERHFQHVAGARLKLVDTRAEVSDKLLVLDERGHGEKSAVVP